MSVAVAVIAAALVAVLQPSGSSSAAAAASAAAPAMGLHPNCSTTCGDVEVPYPFGITPGCSYPAPGFNLTCDLTSHPPQLLLGDGTIRVIGVFPNNSTMLVHRTGAVNISGGSGSVIGYGMWRPDGGFRDDAPFFLAARSNELVVTGCNVLATLRDSNDNVISGCSSFCSEGRDEFIAGLYNTNGGKYCSGIGCCQTCIPVGGASFDVRSQWIDVNDSAHGFMLASVFVAKVDWYNEEVNNATWKLMRPEEWQRYAGTVKVPVVLSWAIRSSESQYGDCPDDVKSKICKSDHSYCLLNQQREGYYTCRCREGYDGNPFLSDGCRDVDECKEYEPQKLRCFGECVNTDGSYKCRCPQGTRGNHSQPGGCVKSTDKGFLDLIFSRFRATFRRLWLMKVVRFPVIIAIAVGSAAGSVFLFLGVIFLIRRFKHKREIKLKQKYFKQNRGQLLQQLVSHNADIAERMIISMDELAKATNNFDKARELGGGGHGTVYKGILSDQHVVAIKKPNKTVQEEIDEFINEVAILSQINHRNVVKLFGCCLETEVPLLVYEFISNGTLYHHLHVEGPRSLPWVSRLRIATETSSALAYLHSSVSTPIIHRDIKSSNILLDDALTSKVADFGASRYIPIDKTGLTTRVQGTRGYLDPMYFYTWRLTEKSDVYSFGVFLVELLTRKKPSSYLSSDGDGLVSHFVNLLDKENLGQILDPQVIEEGGKEVEEVAVLAASCIKLTGEERPTMQQVELALKNLEVSKKDMLTEKTEENGIGGQRMEESSRRYSLEQEFLLSARYPR